MEKLTYKAYCENAAVREQIDEEVRQLRHEAVGRYIVRPIAALFDHSVDIVRSAYSIRGWKSV